MTRAKPYEISKQLVRDAYKKVKANRGAAGVDGQSLAAFEKDLKNNLYKIWNRMSSGSYFPPPVRLVEIPKVYWARRKFKRLRRHQRRAVHWLGQVARREPNLFEMWRIGIRPATGQ